MSRPRLAVVSPRFLFPLDQGGRIRTVNTLRHMKGGAFELVLLSPAPAGWERWSGEIEAVCDRFVSWPAPAPPRLARALAVLGRLPVAVAGDVSAAGRAAVTAALDPALGDADAVLVDFPHAGVLLPERLAVPSILFTHNVEAEIFERHAAVARGPMRLVWRHEARKMRRFEGDVLRRCATVIAVSARDARALEAQYGVPLVEAVETGVDTDYYAYRAPGAAGGAAAGVVAGVAAGVERGTVVFTGSMDSRSNIDGIEFLMEEVWPLVLRERPGVEALIVGRNPPSRLEAAARARGYRWRFTGFVDDVRPHVAGCQVYAIPLRVGSGTRIKVFEAMAMGVPVVSTGLGVEGLDVVDGEHFVRADDAGAFAAGLVRVLGDGVLGRRLSAAARALVERRFGWAVVTRRFEAVCLSALGGAGAREGVQASAPAF